MGDDPKVALSALNHGTYPMTHGPSRLEVHFSGNPEMLADLTHGGTFTPEEADEA